jgi:hypothetical protein
MSRPYTHRVRGQEPIGEAPHELKLSYGLVALLGSLFLGYWAFDKHQRVPILGSADLGIHELGHRLFFWAPDVVAAAMGNGTQSAAPLFFALYFLLRPLLGRRRDLAAAGLCLAWCAATLQDAAVYIADAPYQALPLLHEGSLHDWAFILGPEHFNALNQAQTIADDVYYVGFALFVLGVGLCLTAIVAAARRLRTARP